MQVVQIELSRLHKRTVNPNSMDPARYRDLVAAVRRGFYQPLLVRLRADGDYEIIDGAHRFEAANEVGLRDVPCVVITANDHEASALQIAMNRLRGEVDLTSAAQIIAELRVGGFDVEMPGVLGFTPEELGILHDMAGIDDDDMLKDGSVGEPTEPVEKPDPGAFVLEVPFATAKERDAVKRRLKKLGGGDLAAGLSSLLQ